MTALAFPLSGPASAQRPRPVASTRPRTDAKAVPKLRYIVVLLAGIFAILGGQLLLSIAVSGGAYEIASLKSQVRQSEQKLQIVGEEISALNAPDTLATLAGSMGMIADNNPAYVRLSDGAVVGEASPAEAHSSGQVYAVTAGTESLVQPDIVTEVFATISQTQAVEAEASLALEEAAAQAAATAVEAPAPAQSTPAVTTNAPTAVAPEAPVKRFGGSLPSPVTH